MDRLTVISEELAESFINGNISYVRDCINAQRNPVRLFNAILKVLEQWGHETESFRRLMSK